MPVFCVAAVCAQIIVLLAGFLCARIYLYVFEGYYVHKGDFAVVLEWLRYVCTQALGPRVVAKQAFEEATSFFPGICFN